MFLGKVNNDKSQYGKFTMEMIAVFNEFVPTGRVMLSYTYTSEIHFSKSLIQNEFKVKKVFATFVCIYLKRF